MSRCVRAVVAVALLGLATATARSQPKPAPMPDRNDPLAQPKTAPKTPKRLPPGSLALDALAKVEANYKKPQHLTATFAQTLTRAIGGKPGETGGTLRVAKPDKVRVDFRPPNRKDPGVKTTYLFDGKIAWSIDHPNRQVAQKSVAGSDLPALISFFLGAGTLSRDFKVALTSDKTYVPDGATGLELTSKQPSAAYGRIILVVDRDSRVTKSVIFNSSGDIQEMRFTSIELDKPAPAGTFAIDRKATAGYNFIKP